MSDKLTAVNLALLENLGRVRGTTARTALGLPGVKAASEDALRKRLEKLVKQGWLAAAPWLPNSRGKLYRLSARGAALVGAPSSYADAPTAGTLGQMLAASLYAARKKVAFITKNEWEKDLSRISGDASGGQPVQFAPFFLHERSVERDNKKSREPRLHRLLAEPGKTVDQLEERVGTIVKKYKQWGTLAELVKLGLFAFTVAVPTSQMRESLDLKSFPVQVDIIVFPELAKLIHAR